MSSQQLSFVHTSIRYFYSIALEAITFVRADMKVRVQPRPDGQPGAVNVWDPEYRGFKASHIAIVFFGIFVESALHQLVASRKGIREAKRTDKWTYEKKLRLLGCNDENLFEQCKEYAAARREIVHEKAHLEDGSLRVAQTEAERAFELAEKIVEQFDLRARLRLPEASPAE